MSDVCIPNIGRRERRKRATFGAVLFGVSLAIVVALIALGVSRPVRLVVFLPLWMASLGLFQAREKT